MIAIQNMRLQATNAVEEGVSVEEALKAMTINSALIMGIDKRVGSLEKGKDADLVILYPRGSPAAPRSRPLSSMVSSLGSVDRSGNRNSVFEKTQYRMSPRLNPSEFVEKFWSGVTGGRKLKKII